MANMMFNRGLKANLPTTGIVDGGLYLTTDEGALYAGIPSITDPSQVVLKRLGDFIEVQNVASLPTGSSITSTALYYCKEENILAKWNGEGWTQINKQPTTDELKALLAETFAAKDHNHDEEYDAKGAAEQALADAKSYTNEEIGKIPAQVDYTVSMTTSTDEPNVAKKYTFTQNGEQIAVIDIPKDMVISGASIGTVTIENDPYEGAKVGDKYIEIVVANQDEHLFVPANSLVDIYTVQKEAVQIQLAINDSNEISATVVAGSITAAELAEDLNNKINKAHDHENKTVLDGISEEKVTAWDKAVEDINKVGTTVVKDVTSDNLAVTKNEETGAVNLNLEWGTF